MKPPEPVLLLVPSIADAKTANCSKNVYEE
jgi:hypothetical protein